MNQKCGFKIYRLSRNACSHVTRWSTSKMVQGSSTRAMNFNGAWKNIKYRRGRRRFQRSCFANILSCSRKRWPRSVPRFLCTSRKRESKERRVDIEVHHSHLPGKTLDAIYSIKRWPWRNTTPSTNRYIVSSWNSKEFWLWSNLVIDLSSFRGVVVQFRRNFVVDIWN